MLGLYWVANKIVAGYRVHKFVHLYEKKKKFLHFLVLSKRTVVAE